MPTQPVTFVCRFCYATNHALYPVRLYFISLNEGLIMCANQNCTGIVHGHVDLLKLILPMSSSTSQLTYEQYQQTPYYSPECDFLIKLMSLMLDDEVALGNDNRYKSFIVAIEKVLKQFESSTEWADLITYLARVKKTIEGYSQFPFLPKRITLVKRLAQCLHPALPAGVHLKTLEVYETIFRIIGKRHLQRDLILYSYGLFTLLPVAALPVKPALLTLYELYFLPLGEALNPVLTGFLIGLFSTLEEGADYYHRVILLLDNLANRIDEFYFYTCVWSAIHLVASVRHSAIIYILNHFDRSKNIEDQFHLIGLSVETMVSAVCTCLHDSEQSLAQRSVLDFLLICLPIHKKQLSKINLMKIITVILHILLKRDMSLNKRIYAWFLGTNDSYKDSNNQQHQADDLVDSSSYFNTYTREILIESLNNLLDTISKTTLLTNAKSNEDDNRQTTDVSSSLPLLWTLNKLIRVLLVLVDKSDVGPNIIESIFMNYLLLVYEQVYQPAKKSVSVNIQQENNYSETLKTFNMLLDTLEPSFIWELLTKNFDIVLNQQEDKESITAKATMEQICSIINMLLDISSLDSSQDIQSEHLPEMHYRLIKIMNNNIEKLTPHQITLCIEILSKILKNIIPTDTNHHLSIFHRPNYHQEQLLDNQLTDSDTEDDNEYLILHTHKSQNPTLIITEQQDSDDIERLLRQMVRKVEKQIYKFSDEKQTRSTTTITMLKSINRIEKSIKLYKIFFHRLILTYVIDKNQILINDKFQSIYSIIQNKTTDNLLTIFNQYQQLTELQLNLNDNIEQYKAPFEDCCKLLIELCCSSKQSSTNDQSISSKGKTDFDDWFIDLCVLSLCKTGHFSLQTTAISVLIEVFDYTLKTKQSTGIVIKHLSLFLNETVFFQYIIAYLWEYLSEKYNREYNLKASYTLLILHSMLPNNLCEDLIRNQLLLTNNQSSQTEINTIEGFKRFFKLWNSTRDISNIIKSFQQSVIYILSILREPNNDCLKSMVQQWTYDCFIHGDMCRIFDILLIMLLHADTTRISIQGFDSVTSQEFVLHSKDQIRMQTNFNDDTEEMNEITFSLTFNHGNNDDDENIYENEIEQEESDDGKRTRTNSYVNSSETVPHIKSSPQSIKFPSISSLSQPILSNLLSFSPPVISRSMKQRAPTMSTLFGRSNTHSESNVNNFPRSNSVPTDTIINNSIDLQDAYILLYTQCYDYSRVTLSLNIIESLINLIPQQLVHTLLITSNVQSSSISIHNTQMHELFSKHRQVFDLSHRNNQEYQSYLYILLNTLLIYTYSYYPKSIHISENYKIHIHSLILLTRICHDLSNTCMDNVILINYVINLLKKVSFQKIILCLFNRIMNKKPDLLKLHTSVHDQLTKQYLKQLIKLLEEIILLENIISSTDLNLINQPIVNQTIFLSAVLQYLKQIHFIENHRYIISLVVRILPHCGAALKTISIRVIEQICRNLCFVVQYHSQEDMKMKFQKLSSFDTIDYIIHLIQRLSYICNYCLGNTMNNTQHFTQTLCPPHWMKKITINANDLSDARQLILNKLSSILSSLLFVWKTLSIDQMNSIWLVNNIKEIRETILEFVTSLTKSNGVSFVRTIVKYWGERKRQQKSSPTSKDNTDEIQALINILMNINNYTINDMIYNMNELIGKQSTINDKKKQNYIFWCLQFLLAYLEQQKNVSIDCWSTLAIMFKECLAQSTSPSITFLIIKLLSFYIKQSPSLVEKRDLKDLQDVTVKVLENCNTIVASSLEQTNWLRKNFQVRLAQPDLEATTDSSSELDRLPDSENYTLDFDDHSQSINSSLTALTILAEYAAKLLDTVYNLTDEKDRVVVPYLQNLVINVMPYVRTHVLSNAPSYRSASILLMNISQYSYTKKAWKKEVFEQLFDVGFFQVDLLTLRSWKMIIDNMVKNEKPISFRDLVNRINTVQTGLFVSKEQEYEQRAMLIKRFAFVIYASEKDQYNRYVPEILGCISDLLKLPQVPILYTHIFLFLRVLLIRISIKSLISFWPTLMSEIIQVLLQLEQDLFNEIEGDAKSNIQRLTMNEITSSNISNASLKMYLYACKLLDVLLAMPYSEVDYFQFFRSAFVADHGTTNQNSTNDTFIAFSIRLAKLLERKLQSMPTSTRDHLPIIKNSNCPLLRLRTISNIIELFPFFNWLALYGHSSFTNEQISLSDKINEIETSVLDDFVESWI